MGIQNRPAILRLTRDVGGDVLKLFKKTLSLNGSSPSFTIERKNERNCVVSILCFFAFSTGEVRNKACRGLRIDRLEQFLIPIKTGAQ